MKDNKPIRILQCVNDMHRAGLETMLMNYYRHIDRTKIQFDFLTHRPYRSDYDDEIESLGGRVFYAPRLYPWNLPKYFRWMKKFYLEHPEYKIVHSHIDAMSYLPLKAAKKSGVPVRIAHSHNTGIDRDYKYLLKKIYRSKLGRVCTHRFSCGRQAGLFLFGGKDFTIIPNAVDAREFAFNEDKRANKRRELGLRDEFVVGHIGRMSYQKNHAFLLKIFNEILKREPKSILLLVGVGEKEGDIRKKAYDMGIIERVFFLGNRSDVADLYQAFDVFILPSIFEGVPVVGIEAQFSGLDCFFSDTVPSEVSFSEKCHFLRLSDNEVEWAEEVLNSSFCPKERRAKSLLDSIYNIEIAESKLSHIYRSFGEVIK